MNCGEEADSGDAARSKRQKYYRVALQRIEEAELIPKNSHLAAVAEYLTGYAECVLKALLIERTTLKDRQKLLEALKRDFGHDLGRLMDGVLNRGTKPPDDVQKELVFVSSWSPQMRYEPGPGDAKDAARFIREAKVIVKLADGSI